MSTALQRQPLVTPDEYLALERTSDERHEFFEGQIFAMAGANERHNSIAGNIHAFLHARARGLGCRPYIVDMKVRIPRTGLYTYPDVSLACGDLQFEGESREVLLNPCVLIEVLSKSTETRDRGWKFQNYWNLPSLVDYVLVSQEKPLIEHYVRRPEGNWMFEFVDGLEATLQLAAVDCQIPLREIYLDVQFGPEEDAPAIS